MSKARGWTANALLVAIPALYASARLIEVATGTPRTWIVALEVLSALAFALVDGTRQYGWRGILIFAGICAAIGNTVENIGIATGLPFGRYEFLPLMGPRLFNVPVLLGLAYIGMAYVSWMIASTIGGRSCRTLAVPVLAAVIMTTWDWAQDPVWSTLLHAWRWGDGGAWFGVPLSNYCGWLFTVFLVYLAFWVYLRRWPARATPLEGASRRPALVFYALCAAGNALQVFTRLPQQTVIDATGRTWRVADILSASAIVSMFVMGAFVLAAALRLSRENGADIATGPPLGTPAELPS